MKRETRRWLQTLAKGGASAIPVVGGLISETLGAAWNETDELRSLLQFLEARIRGQERLTAALTAALTDQSVEEAFHEPIEQLAGALQQVEQGSDRPPPAILALLDRVRAKFGGFEAFERDCEERFSWILGKLADHDDRIETLEKQPTVARKTTTTTATKTVVEEYSPASREDEAIPLPPEPHFAHPYALQANFTGRVRWRRELTDWLSAADRPAVYVMEAIGGMGKSAATWFWVLKDVLGRRLMAVGTDRDDEAACRVRAGRRPEGVLWWSFYDSRASFASFVEHALVYCSGGRVDPRSIPSLHDRAGRLLVLLQRRRVLLVLDGLERALRAYAGLGGAYRGDDVTEEEKERHRACVDPCAGAFLQAAGAGLLAARMLITSRLLPIELAGHDGKPLAGCEHRTLTRLDKADAVAFFRAQGVDKGTRAEIEAACERYGYHPLALRLLAGMIVRDPERPGDISVAHDCDVSDDLKPREHRILPLAYNALGEPQQRLLSRLAAFRSPIAYDAIRAIGGFEREADLKAALRELVDRGLLFPEEGPGGGTRPAGRGPGRRHNMHPIIRQYAYGRLADKAEVHGRLRDYFAAAPRPDEDKIQSIDDLDPVIELYHHTVRAGRYDEACDLFRDRLKDALYFRFGAYQTSIELLRGLFPEGEDRPPRLTKEADQSWTLNELASSYSLSGQARKAVAALERQNAIREKLDDKLNLAIGLGNMATQQLGLGELRAAEGNLRRGIDLCREVPDYRDYRFWESVGHQELGRLLACAGRFDEADEELNAALSSFEKSDEVQSQCVVWSYRALLALWMGRAEAALAAAGKAMAFWEETAKRMFPFERDRVLVEWLLGAAGVALAVREPARAGEVLAEAEGRLNEALMRCRGINMVEMEADILLAWGVWHRARGDKSAAGRDAAEALAIAERCEYRLQQADAHNLLARLALDRGDRAEARRHAEAARQRALCDGPPDHTYKPALDEAERLLADLGAGGP